MNRLETLAPDPDRLALWGQRLPNRQRPLLWVQDDGHPLPLAQEHGITPERALEVYLFYGG